MTKNCDNCINSGRPSYEWPCTVCTSAYGSAPSKWESVAPVTADLVEVIRCKDCKNWFKAWIPVSERLPEQGQEVIIYTGNILKPTVMAYQFWNPKYDTWTHVTHWMPLPNPPQEDN